MYPGEALHPTRVNEKQEKMKKKKKKKNSESVISFFSFDDRTSNHYRYLYILGGRSPALGNTGTAKASARIDRVENIDFLLLTIA